jgi:Uma2 family endonuclease
MAAPLSYPTPRRLTRAEYDRMIVLGFFHGERLELIHGTLLRMPPIGPPHASVVTRLTKMLLPPLDGRAEVRTQQPIYAYDDSEPEPDIAVVPLGDYSKQHPDRAMLVIEVADSSLLHDRETKAPLYAASQVAEYWIVDLAGRAIDVYEGPAGGLYTRVRRAVPGETLAPAAFPDVAVVVSELLRGVDMGPAR